MINWALFGDCARVPNFQKTILFSHYLSLLKSHDYSFFFVNKIQDLILNFKKYNKTEYLRKVV
jgi:hypothetical protein